MSKIMELSEKTLVPLSLIGSVCWAIFWAGGLEKRVDAYAEKVGEVKVEQRERNKYFEEILQRLAAIESELKGLHNKDK